jgi:putative ABC transport system permease protein
MRATGDNPQMARAQGVSVAGMVVLGLALANGLIALAGSLFAQYQGFANIQMGVGMIVTGLACIILGETVFGTGGMSRRLAAAVGGTVLLRLLVAAALRLGLDPNALKLLTALLVLAALVLPRALRRGGAFTRPRGDAPANV